MYQAWLQAGTEALSVLAHCKSDGVRAAKEALERLVRTQATLGDLTTLQRFLGSGFRQSILQSLWIRQLADQGRAPVEQEIEFMESFPPRTNTSWYFPLTQQWADILIRSHDKNALGLFVERLDLEFTHEPGMEVLIRRLKDYQRSLFGRLRYYTYRMALSAQAMLRPAKRTISNLLNEIRRRK
jgi:hypothetical protein